MIRFVDATETPTAIQVRQGATAFTITPQVPAIDPLWLAYLSTAICTMAFENEPVRIDSIPALPSEAFEGLPTRYRTLRWLVYAVVVFLALAGLGVLVWFELDAVDEIRWGVWVAVSGVFLLASVWALEEAKGFPLRGVLVREHDLSYRSGFLRRETVTVPFNRIQHSEISQGPVARAFDVCTLKLYTAGNSGANLRVGGMDVERAKRLRERLDERARTA